MKARKKFQCLESITFTTHGEFQYMDNLIPLLQKWRGPISVAVFAPGYGMFLSKQSQTSASNLSGFLSNFSKNKNKCYEAKEDSLIQFINVKLYQRK